MSLNWREIDRVLEELELPGCHVQKVVQPDFSSLVFELYRPGDPFALLVSLAPGKTRLHRLSRPIASPEKLQRFAQLLRSRIKGARIRDVRQVGSDRIVRIALSSGETETLLWIRLWSGAANIIATDAQGAILDAFFRRPGRGEVSGGSFNPESTAAPRSEKDDRYRVRELPGEGSFNERVERFYEAEGGRHGDIEELRARAIASLDERIARLAASAEALARKRSDYERYEQLRHFGDLIMANLGRIAPGERWLATEDYAAANAPIEIELDPLLSPEKNAESYYERYKKAKSGLAKLDEEIAGTNAAIEGVSRDRETLRLLDDPARITQAASRIARAQKQVHRSDAKEERPGLEFQSGPFTIIVGRSAAENDTLLRRYMRGNDLWLHSRDYPGAYVFVKTLQGKSVPLETLLDAGNLALYYSKAKSGGQAELYYAQVKHLRRPREGKLGLVLPTHEKNLSIRLDQKRIDRLFAARGSLVDA